MCARPLIFARALLLLVGCCGSPALLWGHGTGEARLARSGDAYVWEHRTAGRVEWRFGTARVEKCVQLADGRLSLVRFTDRGTRHEYVQGSSDVLAFTWNDRRVTGRSVRWVLDRVTTRRLTQGELLVRLALHTGGIAIVKSYVLYPKESIIQEWLQVRNTSARPALLDEPAALELTMLQREVPFVDFTYMTGAPIDTVRWRFYTTPLERTTVRTFEGWENQEYAPIQVYQNRETHDGVFIGWDYLGRWRSTVGNADEGPVHVDFLVAHSPQVLRPGDGVETPKTFTGVFHGDLDDMGHQLLDYQYRYKWDYTRAPYFPGMEMEGDWRIATGDPVVTSRRVFHLADVMRTIGADIYWQDAGWWDVVGDWNGPNWAETGRYLAQYGMQQTIYLPIQKVNAMSAVAQAHPQWIGGWGEAGDRILDQSQPAVIAWELRMLESKQRLWGNFQWRKDLEVTTPSPDPSRLLAQDQHFRRLVQTFLDRHPGMAFHGCDRGGKDLGYDLLRFGVSWSMNDNFIDRWRGYYPSYLFPPEKLQNVPDYYRLSDYTKAWGRPLLWNRFPLTGDTEDPAKLDGLRELIDIYHYLIHARVLGRWGFVYHPGVTGDSADYYLERLSGDQRRGIVIPGHVLGHPVTIYPKGLLPGERYVVSYQEVGLRDERLGIDLMTHGIHASALADGELIYLNLPMHPGNRIDHAPPSPPSHVTRWEATHMDYAGVEVRWRPGHDDNWVSYYQLYRNGVPLAKVAKGTYYFDHALGNDMTARYAVATVDGSGNESARVSAAVAAGAGALVVDDTSRALTYTGLGWTHQTRQWSVANGTQAVTSTPGDAVIYTFTGSRVTWYGRMGPYSGVAAVYLDGRLDRLVDTHDGDEIPNIALYSRAFPSVESHTLKIVAVNMIVVDGFQVERTAPRTVDPLPGRGIVYRGSGWRSESPTEGWRSVTGAASAMAPGGRVSSQARDQAEYTFTGRGITWVGRRCSTCGGADVYVDGRLATSADMYVQPVQADTIKGNEQRNVPVFTQQWPRRGRHTLRIVVRPDANLWAKGRAVYLDALYVIP